MDFRGGPPVLAPTSVFATCGDFGYDPSTCGGHLVATNYVYEFGGGNIKMIIPAPRGHTMPTVLSTPGGPGGGNQIRDFSLAQEACIWFGDGCARNVWSCRDRAASTQSRCEKGGRRHAPGDSSAEIAVVSSSPVIRH